jgi:hypothetical protein
LIYDQGSLTFAQSWVLLGGFAAGAGIATTTRCRWSVVVGAPCRVLLRGRR